MASVLLVSKPLVPPWNDSSKNLARDVAQGLRRHTPVAMTDGTGRFELSRGRVEPVYRAAGRFAPALSSSLRVLSRLAVGARGDLWHFFFAPNPRTSTAARSLSRLRRVPTAQTVCSRPRDLSTAGRLLFADRTVVLSRATLSALRDAGLPASRLIRIPPAVPPLSPLDAAARRAARVALELPLDARLVVYAGDLELGDGAARMIEGFARADGRDSCLVMACRAKTAGAAAAERELRARVSALGVERRVRWLGETPRIHDLLGCADVVALPSTDLYAKMDLPLVLVEAMWLSRAVLVCEGSPAAELADGGAAALCAPEVDACAAALDALLDDDAREAFGRTARRAAEERYHPDSMVTAYETLYDQMLEERPSRGAPRRTDR